MNKRQVVSDTSASINGEKNISIKENNLISNIKENNSMIPTSTNRLVLNEFCIDIPKEHPNIDMPRKEPANDVGQVDQNDSQVETADRDVQMNQGTSSRSNIGLSKDLLRRLGCFVKKHEAILVNLHKIHPVIVALRLVLERAYMTGLTILASQSIIRDILELIQDTDVAWSKDFEKRLGLAIKLLAKFSEWLRNRAEEQDEPAHNTGYPLFKESQKVRKSANATKKAWLKLSKMDRKLWKNKMDNRQAIEKMMEFVVWLVGRGQTQISIISRKSNEPIYPTLVEVVNTTPELEASNQEEPSRYDLATEEQRGKTASLIFRLKKLVKMFATRLSQLAIAHPLHLILTEILGIATNTTWKVRDIKEVVTGILEMDDEMAQKNLLGSEELIKRAVNRMECWEETEKERKVKTLNSGDAKKTVDQKEHNLEQSSAAQELVQQVKLLMEKLQNRRSILSSLSPTNPFLKRIQCLWDILKNPTPFPPPDNIQLLVNTLVLIESKADRIATSDMVLNLLKTIAKGIRCVLKHKDQEEGEIDQSTLVFILFKKIKQLPFGAAENEWRKLTKHEKSMWEKRWLEESQ